MERVTQPDHGPGRTHARNVFAWVFVALGVVALIAFVASFFFRGSPYGPMMSYSYYGGPFFGWWFFPFGFVFFIFFVFIIFRFAFWGVGGWGWGRRYYYRYGYGDAREILRQRYAKGEITKEQFDQMMRDLEQH